jgi:hypothetical protein
MAQDTQLQDPFELLKKMWAPMGLPMPGAMAPLVDPSEVDKRIADLKSVENWLAMNMNVLRMTIQGLELQRATLAAFQAMQAPLAAGPQPAKPEAAKPEPVARTDSGGSTTADAWWSLLQQTRAGASPVPEHPEPTPEKKPK